MKTNRSRQVLGEGILHDNLMHSARLPQHLEVIFHEGVRGNHLLFSEEDASESHMASTLALEARHSDHCKRVEEVGVQLFTQSDLSNMRNLIRELATDDRKRLFRIYQRMIASWQSHIKSSLN